MRFPGQFFDAEAGLSYNYFRDYDSKTGRYIQSDPINIRGGLNVFSYANANVMSAIDPLGLTAWICQQGKNFNVVIPIQFQKMKGVTDENVKSIKEDIQRRWKLKFDEYQLEVTIREMNNAVVARAGDAPNPIVKISAGGRAVIWQSALFGARVRDDIYARGWPLDGPKRSRLQ